MLGKGKMLFLTQKKSRVYVSQLIITKTDNGRLCMPTGSIYTVQK